MGGSNGRYRPFSECGPQAAGGAARANGEMVLSVVRTAAWGLGAEEDEWQVQVQTDDTVAILKAKVEELYGVPAPLQKVARSADPSAEAVEDDVKVESLARQKVYLQPNESPAGMGMGGIPGGMGGMAGMDGMMAGMGGMGGMAQAIMGAAQEQMEMGMALEESLKDVTYKVTFERPRDAGGKAAGKRVTLDLDALALVGDVQQMVEVELFGSVDVEPTFLLLDGVFLPPHIPIHHAGIEDGKTVTVAKQRPPPTQEEQMMASILGGGGVGGLPPGVLGGGIPPGGAS